MSAPQPLIYERRDETTAAICCDRFSVETAPSDRDGPVVAALVAHLEAEHGVTIRPERLPYGFETACELCGGVSGRIACDDCGVAGWVIEVMVPR